MPFGDNNINATNVSVTQAETLNGDVNTNFCSQIDEIVNAATELPEDEKKFIKELSYTLPPPVAEEYTPKMIGFAQLPVQQYEAPEVKTKFNSLLEKIKPYAGKATKVIAAFGEATLSALNTNPWIAGTVAAIREARVSSGTPLPPAPVPYSGPQYPPQVLPDVVYPQRPAANPNDPNDNNALPPNYG